MPELERVSSILPRAEVPATGAVEFAIEQEANSVQEHVKMLPNAASIAPSSTVRSAVQAQAVADPRSRTLKQVEDILSDGLGDLYKALPADRKHTFKQKGEAVANAITDMVLRGAAKVKEVWKLLKEWLGTLPGMNKYFLEQEIKIKTDRVMTFAESTHA